MSSTLASQEDLKKHKIPLLWRDGCSACQYDDYVRRMKEAAKQKAAAAEES
ncbi:hypothetical protein DFP72DRAFT_1078172 [Ephemerocybe angulata]|uniref:Uncharacterized protein n=1 Tax=Ephemerocybe angulata TaxID=980116 RepID=A0A8H6LXY3_9AGAR|nr:hypothetical protein DFP72DRAFT_1078172 [Tulosesus angulatus]